MRRSRLTVVLHEQGFTLHRDVVPEAGGYLWQMSFGDKKNLDLFTTEPVCEVSAWFHQLPDPPYKLNVEVTVFPDRHPAVVRWLEYSVSQHFERIDAGLADLSECLGASGARTPASMSGVRR
jgi:hypothetical protein